MKKLRNATRSGVGYSNMPAIEGDCEHLRWLLIHITYREGTSHFKTSFQNRVQQGITYSDEEAGLVDEGTDRDEVSKDDADKLGHFEKESSSYPSNSHSVNTVELDKEFNQNTSWTSIDGQSLDNTCFASVSTP